jgi:hypothetical protein
MKRTWGWCRDCHRIRLVWQSLVVKAEWLNGMDVGVCTPCRAVNCGHPSAY